MKALILLLIALVLTAAVISHINGTTKKGTPIYNSKGEEIGIEFVPGIFDEQSEQLMHALAETVTFLDSVELKFPAVSIAYALKLCSPESPVKLCSK